ncbi:hypothetical protein EPIB1_1858 [Tritonibacter mobilis]|jgi:hypothetical protein|uniref:Uncharacterized protein n=1 Tax=Tritonibacter mobilis F1926 TaxID=1265309 RepID=A0A1B1A2M9_9RHOB|nr:MULTISPECIES: hypothetical protein [Tritonibacter]EEW56772.1 hypothetical protein SCH4B_4426 [Ruegeria sp. TrichCH4B]MBW3242298.1 hypothetical protein [Epibacterium sp. DP7N7-1]NKX75459.1 hypothetical protein [Rhodobacteraceae bacterium R_SAG3]ANP40811.1 hypothetical protein K529_008550 [Tritonibacter mobilis F1926]KJZ24145.1 hypothetical protein TW79_09850 [Tritonibacter mobilis]
MSDQTQHSSGSGNGALAFILGGVVVALAVIGWMVLGGENPMDEPDVSIELPGGGVVEGEVDGN